MILYAITWHSDAGKIFSKKNSIPKKGKNKWLCLALLVLLDHMNAIGKEGIKRLEDYIHFTFKKPAFPTKGKNVKYMEKEILRKWFDDPKRENISEKDKNNSLLEHVMYNYFWIDRNVYG